MQNLFTFQLEDKKCFYSLSENISDSSEYGGNTLNYIGQGKLYATCFQQLINYVRVLSFIKKDDVVLDIGCGQAELRDMMRSNRLGNLYIGIEVNDNNIKKITKRFKNPKKDILIKYDVSQKLPFKDSSIDIVTCNLVLEHLPKDKSFFLFREIIRVCKEEGHILIMMPIRKEGAKNSQPKHIYEWTKQDIDNQIKETSTKVLDKYIAATTIKDIKDSTYKEIYKKLQKKIHPIFIRMVFAPLIAEGTDIFIHIKKG